MPPASQRVTHAVTRSIIAQINHGEFASGDKLPPLDKFASSLGVSRSSLREALEQLTAIGIVTVRHGDGAYVTTFDESQSGPPLLFEIAEVRRMIEVHAVGVAAKNRTDDDLLRLRELVETLKNPNLGPLPYITVDRKFHYEITRATKNSLIPAILSSLDVLFEEQQQAIVMVPGTRERANEGHVEILAAIEAGDVSAARRAMGAHIDDVVERIVRTYEGGADGSNEH